MSTQTNLQLYRLLIDRGAGDASLATVRKAYDVALALFGNSVRPSHKPFLAHLVGTAGVLAHWNETIDMVIAGLLHSVYLYGDFRDGRSGAHPARRGRVRAIVGAEAESLIAAYTAADWQCPIDQLIETACQSATGRALVAIKLADLWDEVSDGGPRYCPDKPLAFAATVGEPMPAPVLELARCALSNTAADELAREFDRLAAFVPPTCLVSTDRSSHRIAGFAGLDGPPTVMQRLTTTARRSKARMRACWQRIAR